MSTEPPRTNTRLLGLDGLRGIACLMVFFYHLRWHARSADGEPVVLPVAGFDLQPLFARLDLGVAIFFVLSGLLLSLPFWEAILESRPMPDTRRFLWRRVCRILPAYYAVLLVVYVLRDGTYTFYGFLDFALHATFLHNFTDFSYFSVLGVLWTIGIELQFYILLPLIMMGIARIFKKYGSFPAVTALLLGSWMLDRAGAAVIRFCEPLISDRFLAADGAVLNSGTIFAYLRLFSFGIVAAWLVLRWRISARWSDGICMVALAAIGGFIISGTEAQWRATALLGWPLNAAAIAIFAAGIPHSRMVRAALSGRLLTFSGTISYGIYLWHELVLRAVFAGTLKGNFQGWPLFLIGGIIALMVTYSIASLSWFFIERRALHAAYPFRA